MKEFICAECGRRSYSSVDLQYQRDKSCPYCKGSVAGTIVWLPEDEKKGGLK